ncbi:MAG: hypothetical protein AB1394_14895 [Bacteroidota bacterium]
MRNIFALLLLSVKVFFRTVTVFAVACVMFLVVNPITLLAQSDSLSVVPHPPDTSWFSLIWIIAFLLALSEALSMIPWVKANGVFQLIYNVIKTIAGKK